MELSGTVAWVVGGSSGIGAAVARELQSRGAAVAISARGQDQLDAVSAGTMLAVAADVTDPASLTAAAARIREELGPIDLTILSAAYWKQMTATDWDTNCNSSTTTILSGRQHRSRWYPISPVECRRSFRHCATHCLPARRSGTNRRTSCC